MYVECIAVFHYMKSSEEASVAEFRLPEGQPMVRSGVYGRYLKRFMDVILVLASAPIVLPLVAIFAFLISRDGGPAFFAQERVGKGGRRFTCWKLRSMVIGADEILDAYLAENMTRASRAWAISSARHPLMSCPSFGASSKAI